MYVVGPDCSHLSRDYVDWVSQLRCRICISFWFDKKYQIQQKVSTVEEIVEKYNICTMH